MSEVTNCPACHHAVPKSELAFCAACGTPLAVNDRLPNRSELNALATWTGWSGVVASQEATISYWFMARRDYAHLRKLVDAWNAPQDPVRQLLAAKLDRALVSDPDEFPRDAVSIGARLQIRFRGEVHRYVLVDPAQKPRQPEALSLLSPLGAVLLGMLEGRSLRALDIDGASSVLLVEKVTQPEALTAPAANEAPLRKAAS
jgi:regulator of nucleoside diphosphate kinase